jgi:hypothetical protein
MTEPAVADDERTIDATAEQYNARLVRRVDENDSLAYFSYDVQVELATTERTSVLTGEALQVPGVEAAEPWRFASTEVVHGGAALRSAGVMFMRFWTLRASTSPAVRR